MATPNKTADNIRLLKIDNNCTRERQIIVVNAILDILSNLVTISDIQGDMIKRLQEILHEPHIEDVTSGYALQLSPVQESFKLPKKRGRPKKMPDLQDDLEGRN